MNKRKYVNAHAYHINSISLCSDAETFLSSDDLRVNLWNMNRPERSYNIVDIKPDNMEELTEVITAAVFHPERCHTFMFSSSCGKIQLGDLRVAATCDPHMTCLFEPDDNSNNSFFSEIIASISDIKFSGCGKYVLSRNYLGIKVWDLAMTSRPVAKINISDYLRPKLCDLYENDCIFDKFELCVSGDGRQVCMFFCLCVLHLSQNRDISSLFKYRSLAFRKFNQQTSIFVSGTGSYDNLIHIYDIEGEKISDLRASVPKSEQTKRKGLAFGRSKPSHEDTEFTLPKPTEIDFSKKILHTSWHPRREKIAMASRNVLYIYSNTN